MAFAGGFQLHNGSQELLAASARGSTDGGKGQSLTATAKTGTLPATFSARLYHAQDNPAAAIHWYRTVAEKYSDANQAINDFEDKRFTVEEINLFHPSEAVALQAEFRNIVEAQAAQPRQADQKLSM